MPNITIYLDNETYYRFIVKNKDKQKEIREECVDVVKKRL